LRLLGKEVPDGGGGMAHGDCFVQGKALAPILGGQDVIARTLTHQQLTDYPLYKWTAQLVRPHLTQE
jgi:hypothetical protein